MRCGRQVRGLSYRDPQFDPSKQQYGESRQVGRRRRQEVVILGDLGHFASLPMRGRQPFARLAATRY